MPSAEAIAKWCEAQVDREGPIWAKAPTEMLKEKSAAYILAYAHVARAIRNGEIKEDPDG